MNKITFLEIARVALTLYPNQIGNELDLSDEEIEDLLVELENELSD